jgi:phospholipid/cholesterol/gamma-HCH transport system substrate-binding protein
VRDVVDRVGDVFGNDEGRRQMADALRNLQEITAEINRAVHANTEPLTHAMHNVDNITTQGAPDVHAILQNVRDATDRVDQIVADNQAGVNDTVANVEGTMRNANAASADLREALAHINSITAGVDRGEGTVGRLMRDDALIDEVQGIAEGVNDFITPLTRLQTIVGLRAEYNFISNSLKSYLELRLQPREDRYYLLEFVADTRGVVSRSSEVVMSTNPNEPHVYRRTVETTSDQFRFTLQFARRVGPVTFRFGIKESTGGIGADLHLFRDSFELRTDLFDFSTSVLPRLRVAMAYEIIRRFWIIGGVDDVLNGPRTDYYLGAMLRFNDEDLRSILPFAGGLAGAAR